MSFAGHVLDMIRRDKEYRESRKRSKENRKDRFSKRVFQKNSDYSRVKLSDLEEIVKNTEEKVQNDNSIMKKNTVILLLIGIIIAVLIILGLRITGLI